MFFLFTLNSSTTQISRHHHTVPLEDPSLRFHPRRPMLRPPWACYPSVHPSVCLPRGVLTSGWRRCRGGAWAGRAHRAADHVQRPSRPPRSRCCGCPARPASTARRAPRGPGIPDRVTDPSMPSFTNQGPSEPSPWLPHHTHVGRCHGEDPVQVFHQLLKGWPLRGDGVPALPHDHVPAGGKRGPSSMMGLSGAHQPLPAHPQIPWENSYGQRNFSHGGLGAWPPWGRRRVLWSHAPCYLSPHACPCSWSRRGNHSQNDTPELHPQQPFTKRRRCFMSPGSHGLSQNTSGWVKLPAASPTIALWGCPTSWTTAWSHIWPQREGGVERGGHPPPCTHRSWVQFAGLSIRWPSFRSLKSSSTGIPGYGDPPKVKISHSSTPKDQLETKEKSLKYNEFFFQLPPIFLSPAQLYFCAAMHS